MASVGNPYHKIEIVTSVGFYSIDYAPLLHSCSDFDEILAGDVNKKLPGEIIICLNTTKFYLL